MTVFEGVVKLGAGARIDPLDLRNAFGHFATGITVVTARSATGVHGMTANSFTSVSLDPALLLISIGNHARMLGIIRHSGSFAVNVLGADQAEISTHFSRKGGKLDVEFGDLEGLPTIKDSIVSFACDVHNEHEAGDHSLFLGKVRGIVTDPREPLLYYMGNYRNSQAPPGSKKLRV